jgi:hypothetical protein
MTINPLFGIIVICAVLVVAVAFINVAVIYRKIVTIRMHK